mmetsp:Transcript_28058/g.64231  ORF Transcript_28058/g.64231 Transcript_28058/m.64231 type:complete len:81 (+) Transcript_28058:135-377(+)
MERKFTTKYFDVTLRIPIAIWNENRILNIMYRSSSVLPIIPLFTNAKKKDLNSFKGELNICKREISTISYMYDNNVSQAI